MRRQRLQVRDRRLRLGAGPRRRAWKTIATASVRAGDRMALGREPDEDLEDIESPSSLTVSCAVIFWPTSARQPDDHAHLVPSSRSRR
jgi:hypothetical protein